MIQVCISTSSFGAGGPEALDRLAAHGIAVARNPHGRTLSAVEAANFIRDAHGLIAGTEPLTRDALAGADRLRVISRCGTGLDNVDLKAAAELGIDVAATTLAHAPAVAELTVGAMISLLRRIPQNDRAVRQGKWEKQAGRLLQGRVIGIIGLGKVGKAVVSNLQPFQVRTVAYDPLPDPAFAAVHDVHYTDLETLLREAEIVTLHLPFTPELRHLLDRRRLALMRDGAYLINTSRGGLVDEQALCEFLLRGKLAGAFIDTFESEPYQGPLTGVPSAVLSPHVGAYARESRQAMELEAVENLLDRLKKRGVI